MFEFKKGDWVEIETTVLPANQRAPQVPDDTQQCDLKLWVKGEADRDGKEHDVIGIVTNTGRHVTGAVVAVNPRYTHDYGEFQPELLVIEKQLKEILFGGMES